MLELEMQSKEKIMPANDSTRDILKRGFYGSDENGELQLSAEEALYLMDARNAICKNGQNEISFNWLASKSGNSKKLMARYFTYKDWRDRGLIAVPIEAKYRKANKISEKKYPSSSLRLPKKKLHGVFFKNDLVSVIDENEDSRWLYDDFWIGQYGAYKASERGKLNKLDLFETLFLLDSGILELDGISKDWLIKYAASRKEDFSSMYEVYEDWRKKGYVVKTGFKFGTHFRVYFPGAKPMESNSSGWAHSKHVLHVFPKNSKLLISEWARAIRVAHSVRKTFILAVPGKTMRMKEELDYLLYHRHGGEADNPETNSPKFAMLSLSEEEYIGGQEFSNAINKAKRMRLDLLLAIADRETAVTYYKVRQISLPSSKQDYFEIDWMQP